MRQPIQVRIPVQGMTCSGCESRVIRALENSGATRITASFRRGEARFQVEDRAGIEKAKQAIAETGYTPGEAQIFTAERTLERKQTHEYDFLIIGSGGAAFSAAIEATQHGAKVAMIERGAVGGTCVNIGCVPSKTLLRAGEINRLARHHPLVGLRTSSGSVDLAKLVEQKNELVDRLRRQKYVNLIEDYGFDLIQGEARFVGEGTIEVNGRQITAGGFLVATGATPAVPEIPGLRENDYLTSTTALELKEVPKRLAVIGAGSVALELGQLYRNLGAEVTLMQRGLRILKTYDPEISEAVMKALTEQGIGVITGAMFERVEADRNTKRVHLTVNGEKKVIEADQILVATGRKPNTAALSLEAAGVATGFRGEVIVDEYLRTSNPRIYAAGDVTMGPQFVYVAAYEGAIAAKNALGVAEQKIDLRVVPRVIFTNPSVATVGLTEEQAKAEGHEVRTSILPLDAVPRAIVNRETIGVYKLVADAKTHQVLGVHLVAEQAGDVIYAATLAVKYGLTVQDLQDSLAPYLTAAEGLKLAALTFDKDVSKLSCCAG